MPTILLVDDSAAFRKAASMLLDFGGYNIIEADSGQKAVQLAHERHPDVILCDMHMPGMDGDEVLRALQASETTAGIRFVFLTGLGDSYVPDGVPYLSKPLRLEALQQMLDDFSRV